MKQIIFIGIVLSILAGCSNTKTDNERSNDSISKSLPEENNLDTTNVDYKFRDFQPYKLSDFITADFNGDGKIDTAKFMIRNNKGGVIIIDGKSNEEFVIGCGKEFDEMGDDFSWVDSWGLLSDKYTFNVLVKDGELVGEEKVVLDNPGIVVTKKDSGGGVIIYKNGKYIWLNQSC
jgi:hypothetical protein